MHGLACCPGITAGMLPAEMHSSGKPMCVWAAHDVLLFVAVGTRQVCGLLAVRPLAGFGALISQFA